MPEEYRSRQPRTDTRSAAKTVTKEKEAVGVCPHCGAPVCSGMEICPVCGWKLVARCTFCGAQMRPDDIDCPECGMPADGVMCPKCKIRNFRAFCRGCGQPLSRAARVAVEKAVNDPRVQETAGLLVKISELEAELDGADGEDSGGESEARQPTEGELRLRELMSKAGFSPAEKPKAAQRRIGRSREQVMAEYQKAVEDANRAMEEMLPPAGVTPQEQRNFYTARKVAATEIIEKKWYGKPLRRTLGWECNECHVLHDTPSQCAFEKFGGKWITCTETVVVDAGTEGAVEYSAAEERTVYKRE